MPELSETTEEALINCLRKRFTVLSSAQKPAYPIDMLRSLRSIRLASHLVRRINQRFPNFQGFCRTTPIVSQCPPVLP